MGVAAHSFDLLLSDFVFQLELQKSLARGAPDLERVLLIEVQQATADYFSQAAAAKSLPGEVVFRALPGAQIAVAGARKLTADADGRASMRVPASPHPADQDQVLRASTREDEFYITQELTTLELEPERGAPGSPSTST